jgi:hypothetical protein
MPIAISERFNSRDATCEERKREAREHFSIRSSFQPVRSELLHFSPEGFNQLRRRTTFKKPLR